MVFGGWALGSLRLPADKQWAVREFGRLPIMFGGRVQPLDSLARNGDLDVTPRAPADLLDAAGR